MNKPHKHAQLMLQYAQDAAETEKPWERWQFKWKEWEDCEFCPEWNNEFEYRRKPRTIVINGIEVPEPMRVALNAGETYFWPRIQWGRPDAFDTKWAGDSVDEDRLNAGLCHATREAAEIHAKALLSFTKKEAK